MNRQDAKIIAKTITNHQLMVMFMEAKNNIIDWDVVAIVNKGMTKGAAWNILAKDFDEMLTYCNLAKVNMIREFGEFLPSKLKIKRESWVTNLNIIHQEPDFDLW